MLTRSELMEILSRHFSAPGTEMDDAYLPGLSDDELHALFEEIYPNEAERRDLEKAIRDWTD